MAVREILNFEVRLITTWDERNHEDAWEVALMWKDYVLRRWPIDGGQYYLFTEKPHQRDAFIAEKLAEVFGSRSGE